MENRAYALAAGLFTLLLGLAAAGLIWWLGQNKQDVAYYILEGRDNVTGLNAQAAVRYRGIRAGQVENIDIDAKDRRLILVRISLDARYPLTAGTVAKLNTQGVTGLAYIQLEDDGNDTRPLVGKDGETPRIAAQPDPARYPGRAGGRCRRTGQPAGRAPDEAPRREESAQLLARPGKSGRRVGQPQQQSQQPAAGDRRLAAYLLRCQRKQAVVGADQPRQDGG